MAGGMTMPGLPLLQAEEINCACVPRGDIFWKADAGGDSGQHALRALPRVAVGVRAGGGGGPPPAPRQSQVTSHIGGLYSHGARRLRRHDGHGVGSS